MKEEDCKRCGLCCHFYIIVEGKEFLLPSFVCKHFENGACDIYETRKCLKGQEMIDKCAIPETCAYASLSKGHRKVVSKFVEFIAVRFMNDAQWKELMGNFRFV